MFLFFDTETTGLPKKWRAPVTDVNNWPRMVELAWSLNHADGRTVEEYRAVIRPEGFTIPKSSSDIHGITQEIAEAEGIHLAEALRGFAEAVEKSEFVVGHNVSFDENIIGAEFIRKDIPHQLWNRERICTKLETTDYCAIPGKYGYKWPTLSELHEKVFGEKFDGAHTALEDVRATVRCFFALKKLDVV